MLREFPLHQGKVWMLCKRSYSATTNVFLSSGFVCSLSPPTQSHISVSSPWWFSVMRRGKSQNAPGCQNLWFISKRTREACCWVVVFFKAAATALKEEVQLLKIYTITLTVEERNNQNILLKAVCVLYLVIFNRKDSSARQEINNAGNWRKVWNHMVKGKERMCTWPILQWRHEQSSTVWWNSSQTDRQDTITKRALYQVYIVHFNWWFNCPSK